MRTSSILWLVGAWATSVLQTGLQAQLIPAVRGPQVLHQFTLPPTSYDVFGYTAEEIAVAQTFGLSVIDRPSVGSGLERLQGNYFLGITDRGPSFTVGSARLFPLPQFTPTLVLMSVLNEEIKIEQTLPIVGQSGAGITGIPNSATEDSTPFFDLATPIPYNPSGMDVEDVHTLPGGGYLIVEEYGPSVVVVDAAGVVQRRYTPANKTFPGADYPVSNTLPEILKNRRANRGFECIPVSPDGRTAYTVTQSPMGSTSVGSVYRDSRIVRVLRMDVTDPLNIVVTGQFVVRLSPASDFPVGTAQRDLKISAGAWVANDILLLNELNDVAGVGGVQLVLVDLRGASNIQGLPVANTLDLEDVTKGPEALGVIPAATRVVYQQYETDAIRLLPSGKLEGLAILNANEVAISNDNDFGIGDVPGTPSIITVLRLDQLLPYRGF